MRDISVVLKEKEAELEKVKTQIIALRFVAPLLFEEGVDSPANKPTPAPPPSGVVTATMASAAGASGNGAQATTPKQKGWP